MTHSDPGSGSDGMLSSPEFTDLADSSERPLRSRRTEHGIPDVVDRTRSLLTTRQIGRIIRAYKAVESTNTTAGEWIEDGAPHGAVVVADYQTRGRGRLGRSWTARPGLNLMFSVVLRPTLPPHRIGMLTIAACVGVARAVDLYADPLRTTIKWPNDIYLSDRKLCGMLLEASWSAADSSPAVVLGIGLNVNQDSFPHEIRENATSLLLETGRVIPRSDLFSAVLRELEDSLSRLSEDEDIVRREYQERMMRLGETIRLRFAETQRVVQGTARGIDESGGIILETVAGRHVFHAGEVTRDA